MLDDYLDRFMSRGAAVFYGFALGGGMLMLVISSWLWWHYSYLNPQTAFWAAINNNLITNDVSKRTVTKDNTGSLDQIDHISLGAQNLVRSIGTVTQTQANGQKSVVVSETIGTPKANFARYTKIETDQKNPAGGPLDFKPVINQWSKQDLGGSTNGSFADAIFDAIPFANLNAQQRHQVVHNMQQEDTYKIDFTKVEKKRADGRLYYFYTATVAPDKYVTLLKQVDNLMNLNQLKNLDPAQYQGSQPIQLLIGVDARAHRLSSVNYQDSSRLEAYSDWGVPQNGSLPTNTINQSVLQAKLNSILNGQ